MVDNNTVELDRIKEILKSQQKGLTIAEIAKLLDLNRISTSKYLNILVASGQAEMRIHGPSKVFYPCQRVPISTLLNFSTSLLLVMDSDLTIIDVNNAVLDFFHLEKKEFIGHRINYSPIAGIIDTPILTRIQNALESHESTLETQWKKDGEERYLLLKFIPTVFETGDHGVTLIIEDTTELSRYRQHLEELVEERSEELTLINTQLKREVENHKRARAALKTSEGNYRTVVENSHNAIVVIQDGKLKYVNPRAIAMLHIPEGKKLERPITDYIHPDDRDWVVDRYRRRMQGEDIPKTYDFRLVTEENQTVWVQGTSVLIEWEGRPATQNILTDITERKRAEERLTFQNALLLAQQETVPDGILIVDENGTILFYNRRFAELWKIPLEILDKKDDKLALEFVKAKVTDPDAFLEHVNRIYDQKQKVIHDEISLRDGRTLDRYSAPIVGAEGKYYGRVWYFRDKSDPFTGL